MCYITFGATKTGVTKLNVICVDDSRLTLFSLRRKIGCIVPEARVAACHNAKQAVDFARKNGCDVLLTELDIGGSETGGLDLARWIREINPNSPSTRRNWPGSSPTSATRCRDPAPRERQAARHA